MVKLTFIRCFGDRGLTVTPKVVLWGSRSGVLHPGPVTVPRPECVRALHDRLHQFKVNHDRETVIHFFANFCA